MLHEVVEISELKKGSKIDQKVIVDSPKEHIYNAHFTAMEIELEYLASHDASSLKDRLQAYQMSMTYDQWIPNSMKSIAQQIWNKYRSYLNP